MLFPGVSPNSKQILNSVIVPSFPIVCAPSCLTLRDPIDCSPPSCSVHGFPRQEYWSGLPFPSSGDLPDPGIEPASLTLNLQWQAGPLPLAPPGKPTQTAVDVTFVSLQNPHRTPQPSEWWCEEVGLWELIASWGHSPPEQDEWETKVLLFTTWGPWEDGSYEPVGKLSAVTKSAGPDPGRLGLRNIISAAYKPSNLWLLWE